MYKLGSRHVVPVAAALATLLSLAVPARAAAGPTTVSTVTDRLARQLAGALVQPRVSKAVTELVASGPVDLATVAVAASFPRAQAEANRAVLDLKGLPAGTGSILRLRLADDTMRTALLKGVAPLVATPPDDDVATTVTAYRVGGRAVHLDTHQLPAQPVLVIEVDVAKALTAGALLLRTALAAYTPRPAAPGAGALTSGGYWATKVDAVRLSDDEEPWIKGSAEIYSIVGGFGLDGLPTVSIVQMPYLDNDGTTYQPNQLLVHFRGYKYNLADVVMMEEDGDTNYQQLAQAILTALLTITDQGAYIPLVNAIIAAIPTSWWTDDPDYVDSWYTLSTTSSGRLNGAAGNGWMDVSPYWVSEL